MSKKKKLWIGVTSLVLAFLIFLVLLMIQKNMNKEPTYVEVMCVKEPIAKDTLVTEKNRDRYFEIERIPIDWIPSDYIYEKEKLNGIVLNTILSPGTILTESMVTEYGEYYKNYEELTWISVPVKELYEGVAGSLRSGDYIDVYALSKEEEEYNCRLLAEQVRVEAVYSERGDKIENDNIEGLSQLIVIPMEKAQVALFYEVLAKGNIRIAKYGTL
jgi:hypothetical protein